MLTYRNICDILNTEISANAVLPFSISQKFQYYKIYFIKELFLVAFFDDGVANGGLMQTRAQIFRDINELNEKIEEEKDKKDELLYEIARIDRAIERFRELISDMEALL